MARENYDALAAQFQSLTPQEQQLLAQILERLDKRLDTAGV